ncbi:BgTH12-07774 [Blumeria graminis f. sp. triticale]|uniref:Protein-S-isoprenylcysteine O-methyltransferase n=1 Tax=Blumeria graminis f. sp. triticale TaxID=1689686 RepID=A0A9W4DA30_BLUGR|nr:BgTH12-07774 [Blumeria graminis f. sp. triticale]
MAERTSLGRSSGGIMSHTNSQRPSRLQEAARLIAGGGLGNSSEVVPDSTMRTTPADIVHAVDLYAAQFQSDKPRSLAGIALRSFILGLLLSLCAGVAAGLIYLAMPIWRAPFFLFALCLFHFLEFWTTAHANPSAAGVSSFLLTSNGSAYNIAHSCALLETIISHVLYPHAILPPWAHTLLLGFGLVLIFLGQGVRAAAILTAGPSFSHLVAHHKQTDHILIRHGIYSILRHPSYFGFFWWGIGTQLVCGNLISLVGYAVALAWFFKARIKGEEILLVKFFGDEYVDYTKQTFIGIPGAK